MAIDSQSRHLLNKFLNYTGEPSNRFMLVFATNHKDILDSAITNRISDFIEMALPNHDERAGILRLYRDRYLMDPQHNPAEFIISVSQYLNDEKIEQISSQLAGLAGRNLVYVINAIKIDSDRTEFGLVTPEVIDQVIKRELKKLKALNMPQPNNKQTPLLSPAAIELLNKE